MEDSEAFAWEVGCRTDPIRNQFLIPKLARLLARENSAKILDVGTGTGYIPRQLHDLLNHCPEWTLVDTDPERMKVATAYKAPEMRMHGIVGSIASTKLANDVYDAVLLTFTILEAEKPAEMLADTIRLVAANGILVIAIPDGWKDIMDASDSCPTLAQRFLKKTVRLRKIDKFTGSPYPFFMMRIESLIAVVLQHQCVLESLEQGGSDGEVYMLVFRKPCSLIPTTPDA
jgi:ubiquinone/menaquinone biosynthesis C-methylase UbiE